MNFEKIIPNITKYTDDKTKGVRALKTSPKGLCVPEIIFEYGSIKAKIKDLPYVGRHMIRCLFELKKSYRCIEKKVKNSKRVIDEQQLEDLIGYCKKLGVDVVGFTKVDAEDIFKDRLVLYENAIVLVMQMKSYKMATAPSPKSVDEVFRTYKGLGIASNKIANKLKKKGFNAQANTAIGGDVNFVALAEKAGLGVAGKHGLLITKEYGPSLRIAAVYTDIENLPLAQENEHLWIREFCKSCKKCVRMCPVSAIYEDFDGHETQTGFNCIDYKKCAGPFSNMHGYSVCIKECSFFNGKYDELKKHFSKL